MKRLLLAVVFCFVIGCGCDDKSEPVKMGKNGNKQLQDTEREEWYSRNVNKFDHEGHTYLWVTSFKRAGLVHDPDCPCKVHDE